MVDMADLAAAQAKLLDAAHNLTNAAAEIKTRVELSRVANEKTLELAETAKKALDFVQDPANLPGAESLKLLQEDVLPLIIRLEAEQTAMRATLLRKTDDLQGSVDLLRSDVATNFHSATFALNNSRNGREDVNQLIDLVTQLQRSQSLLSSQVDELRKAEQERRAGL